MSDYLLAELREAAGRPTLDEMRERLSHRRPVDLRVAAAEVIRAERDTR